VDCVAGWSMYQALAVTAGVCITQHVTGLTEVANLLTYFVFAGHVANNQNTWPPCHAMNMYIW